MKKANNLNDDDVVPVVKTVYVPQCFEPPSRILLLSLAERSPHVKNEVSR